jgi:5-oxoprolinase (ATP-hydrolysing) subunit C
MSPLLEVLAPGVLTSIQDQGRCGFRRCGVPCSGVLHPELAAVANALVGNPQGTPVLEMLLCGPTLRAVGGAVRIALAGDLRIDLHRRSARYLVASWRSLTLSPGDILQAGAIRTGRVGYLAMAGGAGLEPVLGSCSTNLRGRFGGLEGRPLAPGCRLELQLAAPPPGPERSLPRPAAGWTGGGRTKDADRPGGEPVRIRVVLGPQQDYFSAATLEQFCSASYSIARDSDRMGSRLLGPRLAHSPGRRPEIVSDAVVPGAIQVPGNGAPIVLLADGPTVGGYPKIATVASADLPSFAALAPGARVRFEAVSLAAAEGLLRARRAEFAALLASIRPMRLSAGVDLDALIARSRAGAGTDGQGSAG